LVEYSGKQGKVIGIHKNQDGTIRSVQVNIDKSQQVLSLSQITIIEAAPDSDSDSDLEQLQAEYETKKRQLQ